MSGEDVADINVNFGGTSVRVCYSGGNYYLQFRRDEGDDWVHVAMTTDPGQVERLGLACRQATTFAEACDAA